MSHKITYPISAPSTIPTEYTVAFYDLSIPSEQSWVWTIEFMMPDGEMKDNVMVSKGEGLVNISWPLNYTSFEMATLHVKAMTIAAEIGRLLKHLPDVDIMTINRAIALIDGVSQVRKAEKKHHI